MSQSVSQQEAYTKRAEVHRKSSSPRQGRDGAVYVRQQKPRSLFMWLFIWGPVTLWLPTLYFQFSPRYFWKA